jgi:hypothetical protein
VPPEGGIPKGYLQICSRRFLDDPGERRSQSSRDRGDFDGGGVGAGTMKKVLIVTPSAYLRGGVETIIHDVCRELPRLS